jgi:hypothetical protein
MKPPESVVRLTNAMLATIAHEHPVLKSECDRMASLPDAELCQEFVQLTKCLRRYSLEFGGKT